MIIKKNQKGYALITLLFFMTISLTIITGVVIVVLNNATATTSVEQRNVAYYAAESGAENALLRLIRDPNYTGETLIVDQGTVVIQINNGTIISTATVANVIKKVQIQTLNTNNQLTVTSWKEIN
jgi:type II secretory pathway component PulK